jgi:hypothetical protein
VACAAAGKRASAEARHAAAKSRAGVVLGMSCSLGKGGDTPRWTAA